MCSPVLIWDDASFDLLMVFANPNRKPGAQFTIVQGIHDTEHLSFVKTKSVGRFFFILKMGSNVEGISHIRFYDATIHYKASRQKHCQLLAGEAINLKSTHYVKMLLIILTVTTTTVSLLYVGF